MVGHRCCFVHCKNKRENTTGVTFFGFPKCERLKQLWIAKVRRPGWKLYKSSRLCSDHFTADCFEEAERLQQEFGLVLPGKRLRQRLKPDAVPSLFVEHEGDFDVPSSSSRRDSDEEPGTSGFPFEETSVPPVPFHHTVSQESGAQCTVSTGPRRAMHDATTQTDMHVEEGPSDARPRSTRDVMIQTTIEPPPRMVIVHVPVAQDTAQASSSSMPVPHMDEPIDACVSPENDNITFGTPSHQPLRSSTPFGNPLSPDRMVLSFSSEGQEDTVDVFDEQHSSQIQNDDPSYQLSSELGYDSDGEPVDMADTRHLVDELEAGGSVEQPSSLPDMYIVSRSCLVELLQVCALCSSRETSVQLTTMGSLARATVTCVSGHRRQWNSQPLVHEKPAGNIAMCSAILFSGSSITKSLRLFDIMGIARIHRSQYFEYQKCYLFPAIQNVWEKEQAAVTEKLEGRPLHLAGDARCDSPGHTALHGTYTVMETTVNRIVHFEVVKATTVSSSYCMEQKGLELCLDYIATKGMEVNTLVTDRHSQVKAFLRNKHPHISHRFDVWHVAKGIKKKIAAVSQSKKHQVLRLWCESIIRHLYWCARTSDNGELLLAKWETVVRHVINVHSHPNSLHPVCFHGDLGEREWLHEGTETYKKLHDILLAKQLVKDIPQLSSAQQTFGLETFHAVLIHFAPKSNSFSDQGMVARYTHYSLLSLCCKYTCECRLT
ncbi:uncharacterized protein LOC135388606 isoform X2 [Ornithodoros turicata]|uniref:uncharacterized protein LOC135388606 isoform X2 n=1 Tax=Ornithodoros turicata TaxID=34597 RepID=UPI003138AB7A